MCKKVPVEAAYSLDHVRSHLARCDEVQRMFRGLRRPLQRNSIVELMPVVLALALVDAGGGDIISQPRGCHSHASGGGVSKETAAYHAALSRRMGGKAGVIGAVEAAFAA